jgi:glycerophosphoryl diester phosphodiesterase
VREIREAGASGKVVISSFNHHYLRSCRQMAPEIATAALEEDAHPPDLVHYLQSLGVCAYHPQDALVDEALVARLRAADLHVNVFTVNDPARRQQLFRWGTTGIFTDFPEVFPSEPRQNS